MKCSETGALLDLLMDGALREDQLEALEAHARECPECAAQLRATRLFPIRDVNYVDFFSPIWKLFLSD